MHSCLLREMLAQWNSTGRAYFSGVVNPPKFGRRSPSLDLDPAKSGKHFSKVSSWN